MAARYKRGALSDVLAKYHHALDAKLVACVDASRKLEVAP